LKFEPTRLPGVLVVEPVVHRDARGFFLETYHAQKFRDGGIAPAFVQDNHSASQRGTLRGLHAQWRRPQGKLVRVLFGEIFDVAVDARHGSPTFGQWVGVRLSAENKRQLWVPEGFAHGFVVLSEYAEFLYKTTDYYAPSAEGCVRWDDPDLAIPWPLDGLTPSLSGKDAAAPLLAERLQKLIG